MKPIVLGGLLLSLSFGAVQAITGFRHQEAPRLLNYYLRSDIVGKEAILAQWDMLVFPYPLLDTALPTIQAIRALNPDQIMLAYIDPVLISDNPSDVPGSLQHDFVEGIDPLWMAYSTTGEVISFWEHSLHVNTTEVCPVIGGERYRDYFNRFIRERFYPLIENGTIDGVFFDEMSSGGYLWWGPLFPGDFDYDLDSFADHPDSIQAWLTRSFRMFADSTGLTLPPGGVVLGNNSKPHHRNLNGKLYEAFPGGFEGYLEGTLNDIDMWNSLQMDENILSTNGVFDDENDLAQFRFRYAASLLTDNYFSYDYTTLDHHQLRWYELFDTNLGLPLGPRYTIGETPAMVSTFEGAIGPYIADSYMADFELTDEPGLVIEGEQSLLVDVYSADPWPALIEILIPGGYEGLQTYTISLRYRILESELEESLLFFRYWTPSSGQYSGQSQQMRVVQGSSGMFRAKFQLGDFNNYKVWLKCRGDVTMVVDSVSVVAGEGGLWARDYQRGAVVCNDSGETRTLPHVSGWSLIDGDGQYESHPGWLVGNSIDLPNSDGVVFLNSGTSVAEDPVAAPPADLAMRGPWPNPGNPTFSLVLSAPSEMPVVVSIHDLRGRSIAELWRGPVQLDGQNLRFVAGQGAMPDLASGVYLIRAEGGGTSIARKWVLLR